MNPRHVLSMTLVLIFASLGSAVGQLKKIPQDVIDKIAAALPEKAPAQPKKPRKVLLFSKTNGFRHGSISVGVKSLTMLGEKTGAFTAEHSEDEAVFAPKNLQKYDLVIMVNTTGEIFRPRGGQFIAVDDRKWRAEFVGHSRNEQTLGPIGFIQFLIALT